MEEEVVLNNNNIDEKYRGMLIDIEAVIEARNPKLRRRLPNFVINYLKRVLHQEQTNKFIWANRDVVGLPYAETIVKYFGADVTVFGLDNVPDYGRYVFASNHPMGGLDGMAFMYAVGQKFQNLKFPVNDLLMFIKNFKDIFLPVNKLGTTGRKAAELMEEAFASDNQILMFPAGLCSRKQKGKIVDLQWKKGFVTKAIQSHRDIVPVYISGRNSNFFYNLSNIRKFFGVKANIEMIYLVDEMYKQYGQHVDVYFGKPVKWQSIENLNPKEVVEDIKKTVYSLCDKK
ncbi:MAG: 1-acyl-sn-glycerol-3-phosphate acyltransferase [Bacteroidales bacterium]|nr:1-acyl-sn-glycerol-3-phosphate acyltransferase [Bacteroidales bacterium]